MSLPRLVMTAIYVEGRNKSEVAREYRVSRRWVQKLAARYEAEGEAAFAIIFSFVDPAPWIAQAKAADARTICQVQDYLGAERAVSAGADVLIAQGTEAGGHTGTMGVLPLLAGLAARHPNVAGNRVPGHARGCGGARRPQAHGRGKRRFRHRAHPGVRHPVAAADPYWEWTLVDVAASTFDARC
jgi:hypothetical protein